MKINLKLILSLFSIIGITAVQAQESRKLNLNEAIELSLRNSKQLKISNARIDEAVAAVKEASQKKLPDAGISGSYLRLSSANVDLKTQSNSGGNGSAPPKVSQAMYGIVNASLPIYTGGRIRYGIESARFLAEAAKLDAINDRDEVIMNTVEAYVNLFKARAAVDMVHENLTQAQQRVKDFSSLEKNGLLARNELLKAELQASNTELTLLEIENNWQLANINMNLMLGLPEKTRIETDSTLLMQDFQIAALDDYLQSALKNRKDLESSGLKKQAADAAIKIAKGEYYPGVQLTGGYIAADIPKLLTVTNAVNIGIGFSYNISSLWKTKTKLKSAEARARQIEAGSELLSDQIRLQVNRNYLNWFSSEKKIEVLAKSIEQAEENYRITQNKYRNSLATTTELLDADLAQLQAKLNYVFARADAVVIYKQLQQSAAQIDNSTK